MSMNITLGKLERFELRSKWATEDKDFTPWLAQENNLTLLSDVIGIELELESCEKDVGAFRADILCKNIEDGSWVLIENQIERTDHKHLGQLLTYAAGLQAVTIIWIASQITPEHREVLDWLNKITDENFRFFGLEIELWQIDNSNPAPNFNVISQPNNWSKSVRKAAKKIDEQAMSKTQEQQYRYWEKLRNYLQIHAKNLRLQKIYPQHWYTFSINRSGFNLAALIHMRERRLTVELCITNPEYAKYFYHALYKDKETIESEFGDLLEWKELPNKISCKIQYSQEADPMDEVDWSHQHLWFKEKLELFNTIFRQRIKNL